MNLSSKNNLTLWYQNVCLKWRIQVEKSGTKRNRRKRVETIGNGGDTTVAITGNHGHERKLVETEATKLLL
jgi:hypothetical protein